MHTQEPDTMKEWQALLKPYEGGDTRRSLIQFFTTLSLYILGLAVMFTMVFQGLPYWAVLLVALPVGGLHVRIFIIMHDCGHNAFLPSPRASKIIGRICAVITFTPYYDWLRTHAVHHATVGDLDRRGIGDVWTMTVKEYREKSFWGRLVYRIYRNPIFFFGIGPFLLFVFVFRFPRDSKAKRSIRSIVITNLMLVGVIGVFALTTGIVPYLMVMLPILAIAGFVGVWLFFVQHQFREVYWSHTTDWNSVRAALEGSSFYCLPAPLRWFSGSIGYHHIHHLNPRIPNYNLRRCHQAIPALGRVEPITLSSGFRSMFLQLWDENTQKLENWRILRRYRSESL